MRLELKENEDNKDCENYSHVSGKCVNTTKGGENQNKGLNNYTKTQRDTKKRKDRRNKPKNLASHQTNKEERYIKNTNKNLTYFQTKVISRGLKFIPVNKPNTNRIRRQLLQDFQHFERRMRLKYMFHKKHKEVHPFHVKSNWNPPVQKSVALESFLEEVKMGLDEIKITKPKQNLSRNERKALNEMKQNKEINLKKADKGSTTVVMNTIDKIQEGQIQINDQNNYRPLDNPMVKETHSKVSRLIRLSPW